MVTTTRKARSVLALVMAVAMLMTLLVVPSSASDPADGVVMFRGRAAFGPAEGFKPKPGDPQELPTSGCDGTSGLHFPMVAPGWTVCYEFASPGSVRWGKKPPAWGAFCEAQFSTASGPCDIYAAGLVGPTLIAGMPVGAHCGISKGTDGNGRFRVWDGPAKNAGSGVILDLKLYDLEWNFPLSAGDTFVVTGKWRNIDMDNPSKKGELIAIVQGVGTSNTDLPIVIACWFVNGASSFDMNGVAFLS